MSLGFNQNRKHRTSTLPGSVNSMTVRESPRRSATTPAASVLFSSSPPVATTVSRRRSPTLGVVLGSKRPPALKESIAPSSLPTSSGTTENKKNASTTTDPQPLSSPLPPAPQPPPQSDDVHVVYATVTENGLMTPDGDIVVHSSQRVVLVYPMASEGDDGIVTMRMKRVHPVTGQLSYVWVRVYDPNTETRYVTDFALVP